MTFMKSIAENKELMKKFNVEYDDMNRFVEGKLEMHFHSYPEE